MEHETIELIGKRLRERLSLPEDIPAAMREALQALADAEYEQSAEQSGQTKPA
jgi:hypothetical protein